MSGKLIKGERFHVGEIWRSPRGYIYRVVDVDGRQATLRMGMHVIGRKIRRWVDDINGWSLYLEGNYGLQQTQRL